MGKTYKQLYREIAGTFPKSTEFQAQNWINRAWSDIRDSRHWSFLKESGIYFTPAKITTGTVAVTQFSATVTFSASARAVLATVANPLLTKRQIRVGSNPTGPVYSIISLDASFASNGIATLDRIYRESTNSTASYQIYRCYFGPPENDAGTEVTDFLRFNSIYQPSVPRYFVRSTIKPLDWLNVRDPQRNLVGQYPVAMFPIGVDSNNQPQFEMWPHWTTSEAFVVSYQRKGVDLSSDNETLPPVIPDDLVIERASYYGCLWADKQKGRYTELQGVNWLMQAGVHKKTYSCVNRNDPHFPGLLEQTQAVDEEQSLQNEIISNRGRYALLGDADLAIYHNINA